MPSKRNRHRGNNGSGGKSSFRDDDNSMENSMSPDHMYSMEESSGAGTKNNRNKKKKMGKSGKGIRRP